MCVGVCVCEIVFLCGNGGNDDDNNAGRCLENSISFLSTNKLTTIQPRKKQQRISGV